MNTLINTLARSTAEAAARADKTFLLPVQASTAARESDWLFNFINASCLFFFVIIVALMVLFTIKYLRKSADEPTRGGANHNLPLELAWSIIPGFLLIFMFFKGFVGYMDQMTPPDGAFPITVKARQWSWEFVYPNGYADTVLTVPVDTPVVLTMSSSDVIHSFYVPEFRTKMDVVPGKYSKAWFEATVTTGLDDYFNLFCAEYCGQDHSRMITKVHVLDQKAFEAWMLRVVDTSNMPPADRGKRVAGIKGCVACHSDDGSGMEAGKLGPTWQGIWGRSETLTDGATQIVDENYVRDSILNPNAKVVQGFAPVMPSYQGQITEQEILDIIEYMKSLQ